MSLDSRTRFHGHGSRASIAARKRAVSKPAKRARARKTTKQAKSGRNTKPKKKKSAAKKRQPTKKVAKRAIRKSVRPVKQRARKSAKGKKRAGTTRKRALKSVAKKRRKASTKVRGSRRKKSAKTGSRQRKPRRAIVRKQGAKATAKKPAKKPRKAVRKTKPTARKRPSETLDVYRPKYPPDYESRKRRERGPEIELSARERGPEVSAGLSRPGARALIPRYLGHSIYFSATADFADYSEDDDEGEEFERYQVSTKGMNADNENYVELFRQAFYDFVTRRTPFQDLDDLPFFRYGLALRSLRPRKVYDISKLVYEFRDALVDIMPQGASAHITDEGNYISVRLAFGDYREPQTYTEAERYLSNNKLMLTAFIEEGRRLLDDLVWFEFWDVDDLYYE